MDKLKSKSMIRRLIHRESSPQLTFGHSQSASKDKDKTRRKSEGMLSMQEHLNMAQNTTPMWYLKEIRTRDAAEEILKNRRIGTFLVRDSETSKLPGCYTLTLLHKDRFRHHKIETNPKNNKLVIKGYENHQFEDLEKLVEFFVKSQKKDITLIPYNPNREEEKNGKYPPCIEERCYEEMDRPESRSDEYLIMDPDVHVVNPHVPGFAHQNEPPPPLPSRREPSSSQSNYENLIRHPKSTPPPPLPTQSYENIPAKGQMPVPSPPTSIAAPSLPPRSVNMGPGSYENIPGRPPPRPASYENYGGPPSHGHSYQNLPPKVAPRKAAKPEFHSAEHRLPPRPVAPLRRSRTDTDNDWQRRGFK